MRSSLFVLLTLLPLTARAGILWKGEFENSDLSEWDSYVLHSNHWTFQTTSPAPRSGTHYAKAELQNADTYNSFQRVEVEYSAPLTGFEGSDLYYAWSAQLDSAEPFLPMDHEIAFFESTGGTVYHQMFGLHVDASSTPPRVAFSSDPESGGGYTEEWHSTMTVDVWHDFILHVKWSLDKTVGFFELWMDGTQVVQKKMMRTMVSQDGTTALTNGLVTAFHAGILLSPIQANKPNEAVYLDRFLIGTSMADVAATPVDAGTPMPDAGVHDAGTVTDAGTQPMNDAGTMTGSDAGTGGDAGTGPAKDAGSTMPAADAGNDIPNPIAGCSSVPAAFALLAVFAVGLKRKRRR